MQGGVVLDGAPVAAAQPVAVADVERSRNGPTIALGEKGADIVLKAWSKESGEHRTSAIAAGWAGSGSGRRSPPSPTIATIARPCRTSTRPMPSPTTGSSVPPMTQLSVAALQMAMGDDLAVNVATAERLVRNAAAQGAQVILIPELFEGPYFCKDQLPEHLDRAVPLEGHPTVAHFAALAAELGVVLPLSIYERAGQALFNTVVIVDADGTVLGHYRKSHIPDGPGYTEKYYFSPGDTGFRVWATMYGTIGVGICWDQWFPESARSMALLGAEVLLYPTAIGSEPPDPSWDSSGHWQRVMQGHAGANLMPSAASGATTTPSC